MDNKALANDMPRMTADGAHWLRAVKVVKAQMVWNTIEKDLNGLTAT